MPVANGQAATGRSTCFPSASGLIMRYRPALLPIVGAVLIVAAMAVPLYGVLRPIRGLARTYREAIRQPRTQLANRAAVRAVSRSVERGFYLLPVAMLAGVGGAGCLLTWFLGLPVRGPAEETPLP
jgi:hypothetical protein